MTDTYQEVKEATDEAIDRGLKNSSVLWREYALECVHKVCLAKEEFTMDDVRDLVRNYVHQTHDLRAMGGVVKTAKKLGWCVATDRVKDSKNRIAHGTKISVWRSLIYKK